MSLSNHHHWTPSGTQICSTPESGGRLLVHKTSKISNSFCLNMWINRLGTKMAEGWEKQMGENSNKASLSGLLCRWAGGALRPTAGIHPLSRPPGHPSVFVHHPPPSGNPPSSYPNQTERVPPPKFAESIKHESAVASCVIQQIYLYVVL